MPDVWTTEPTDAARALRACGFSPHEAERLMEMRVKYARGAFVELTALQKRQLFVRWLIQHGRLGDW